MEWVFVHVIKLRILDKAVSQVGPKSKDMHPDKRNAERDVTQTKSGGHRERRESYLAMEAEPGRMQP